MQIESPEIFIFFVTVRNWSFKGASAKGKDWWSLLIIKQPRYPNTYACGAHHAPAGMVLVTTE